MTNQEAKIHLQSAKLMLLGADGQPVSDLYYAVEKGIEALEQGDVLQEIRQEIAQIKATQLYSTIDLKDMVLAIIDKHMEEHHD